VVALKTVLEVKSAGGVLRNRISADPPPPLGWITRCSGLRDCLPSTTAAPAAAQHQHQHRTAQHQHSTRSRRQRQQLSTEHARPRYKEQHQHPAAQHQHSSTTSDPRPTLDNGSAGAAGARIPERRSRKNTPKPAPGAPGAARQPERRKAGDDETAEALCPTKAEKG